MALVTVAALTLHTIPLDFIGNRDAVVAGIKEAKSKGATLIVTPELCLPGYGALDHHLEADTFQHSWEMLASILQNELLKDVIVDIGMGVRHRNVRYNCRVVVTYKRVILIKPKMSLANDGLYREMRHFSPWMKVRATEKYQLEAVVSGITGQDFVPIGDAIIWTKDTSVAAETCEELFVPNNPSIGSGLAGAEIITNSSASHAELRKLRRRLDLISNSTAKLGGLYIYTNATGLDGEARMMFDGSSMVILNGKVVAQDTQFSLKKTSVVTATINLEAVRSYRSSISRNLQAAAQPEYPDVYHEIHLSRPIEEVFLSSSIPTISTEIELKILDPMEEIWKATAVYLWQYLVITNAAGFFLALSGGIDSCCTALMVSGMARLVLQSIQGGDEKVLADLRKVTGIPNFLPTRPEEIVSQLFHSSYMGTVNSGEETRSRAKALAAQLGAFHSDTNVDASVSAFQDQIQHDLGFRAKYAVNGGSNAENLALQNITARSRMVYAYSLAQLSTTARNTPRKGSSLLVLGSANVDEILRGYLTKYDCSSADLNPIGSISKTDLRSFITWAMAEWNLPILESFISAVPSAELLPLSAGVQSDEVEMGLTYEELSILGTLRKSHKLGAWSCYLELLTRSDWQKTYSPMQIAEKVTHFFRMFTINRHKATVITPAIHLSSYNPDDNRHDLRPFLLLADFPLQFEKIRKHAQEAEAITGKKTIKAD